MTREEQLQWEARWGRVAGIAAIAAALLLLLSGLLFLPENRPGTERYPDELLAVDADPGAFAAWVGGSSLGALLMIPPFLVLFRATLARGGGIPHWFVYLIVGGPILAAVGQVLYSIELRDVAEEFASGGVVRGERGGDRADDLTDISPAIQSLPYAGLVATAFVFVLISLRGRAVGLLSPFMGILGVIVGIVSVLDILAIGPVIKAFWLGAVGMLLIGQWPGGRGPAWDSGEAEPWPTAAQRRGLAPMPGEEPRLDPDDVPPEPEPVPERPASRKRRKKR